jgi:cell division protease FtsH
VYAENQGEVFLGRSVTQTTNISEATLLKVDQEIRRILDEQYELAEKVLRENADKVEMMTKALMEWETIGREQVEDIMAGKEPRPPKDWTPRAPASGGGPSGGAPAVTPDPAPTAA